MPENLDDLTPEEGERYLDWKADDGPLAVDLSIAFIKYRLAISFRTAEENYVKGEVVTYWVMTAELVNRTYGQKAAVDARHNLLIELRQIQTRRGN